MGTSKVAFATVFPTNKPLIGMIHLPAMPGRVGHRGMAAVIDKALRDLDILQRAGFDAALVENDSDQPPRFIDPCFPCSAQRITVPMATIMRAVRREASIPVGLEIVYDMVGTIDVAHEVGAQFVRIDVFVDNVQSRRWGVPMRAAADAIAQRMQVLDAHNILLLTDIQVKHTIMLDDKTLEQSAIEAVAQGSGGLIITGQWTGKAPNLSKCQRVRRAVGGFPILVGSGFSAENAHALLDVADGAMVGTSIKTGNKIDLAKARHLVQTVAQLSRVMSTRSAITGTRSE